MFGTRFVCSIRFVAFSFALLEGVIGQRAAVAASHSQEHAMNSPAEMPTSARFQPLAKIAQLRGVYFDWDAEHGGYHDLGMIAEEVGAVLPEIVQYEPNGIDAHGMDYSKLAPLLVEAINAMRSETDRELAKKTTRLQNYCNVSPNLNRL